MVIYKKGNLLRSDCKVICHQVNCCGEIAGDISQRIIHTYPMAYRAYRLRQEDERVELGTIDITANKRADKTVYVVNLYAQRDYLPLGDVHTSYRAFRRSLRVLKRFLQGKTHYTVGFPAYIGCDEAGGNWNRIKKILEEEFAAPQWKIEVWDDGGELA